MHTEHVHLFPYLHTASPCLQFQFNAPLNKSLLLHLSFLGQIKYKHLSTKHMNLLYSLHQLCLAGGFTVKHYVCCILFSEESIRSPEASITGSCEQSDKRAGNQTQQAPLTTEPSFLEPPALRSSFLHKHVLQLTGRTMNTPQNSVCHRECQSDQWLIIIIILASSNR